MNKKTALYIMLTLLGTVLVFHFLIITQQIPYDKVWAGRLHSVEEMMVFETFSILINLIMLVVLFIKYKLLEKEKNHKVIDVFIWIFVAFFALNTLGNLFAENIIELVLGTLLTGVSSFLCYIIVKKKELN